MVYHHKYIYVSGIYMPIIRSTDSELLHMVFSTRCCGCGSTEPVCSGIPTYTQCTRLHTGSLGPQPQHLVLNTICSITKPVLLKMDI